MHNYDIMRRIVGLLILLVLIFSCTTSRYIHDESSAARHNILKSSRSKNVVVNSVLTTGSIILSAILGGGIIFTPGDSNFKKITLENTGTDTLYVNMLTDYVIQDSTYCDYMDVRIPPQEKCRLLFPVSALYNVYFTKTPGQDNDEMIEIDTFRKKRLILYPGMTILNDSIPEPDEIPTD